MGHRDKSYCKWRCMLTATPRTAGSTKDASLDGVWGQISLVFLLRFMFYLRLERNGTSKMGWDFENGTLKWDFKLGVKRSANGQETPSSLFHPDMHRWASLTKILVPLILIRYFMNLVPLTASPLI